MYKVIIVDDEKQILDGLSKMIKWREFDFEVCATARNGVEAIPLIKAHKADLVLTDVRMPVMDGLKMLKYIREHISKDIEFIILSGYSEFQYAQKAMQYNVKNYILKPVDEDLLYASLVDIKNNLDEKEIRKSLKIKSYINNIIMGDKLNSNELILENEEIYGLYYITIERHREIQPLVSYDETKKTKDLANLIAEKIGLTNMRFVLRHDMDTCHMVVGQSLLSCFEYDVRNLATCLSKFLSICKTVSVDIMIGKKVIKFKDLHESIQTINQCKNKRFYQEDASILIYEDIKEEEFCKLYEDNGAGIKIISAFRKNDMKKLKQAVEELMEHFERLQVVPEIALIHLDSIMASIIQILSERMDEICEVLELYSTYKKIQDKHNIFQLGKLVTEFCIFCNQFSANGKKEKKDIVGEVIRFVEENYMEHLKIIDIAKRFFVNPAYLGQQFIKKKGCSLNHYINSVRIEKSKELLVNTNLKIYEVAEKVGFDDPNYFSCKFLEYSNQTPSDFRDQQLI